MVFTEGMNNTAAVTNPTAATTVTVSISEDLADGMFGRNYSAICRVVLDAQKLHGLPRGDAFTVESNGATWNVRIGGGRAPEVNRAA